MPAAFRILVPSLVLLAALAFALSRGERPILEPETATRLPQSLALPDVPLTGSNGTSFRLRDIDGYSLLFFGFTHCPDICPLTLQALSAALADLRQRGSAPIPDVLFVSVDPYRDTPERIRQYLSDFDSGITGATASDDILKPLLDTLGVTVHKAEVDGEWYNVVHNGTIFVLDPAAELIAVFGGSSHRAEAIASDFLRIRRADESRGAP